MQNEQTPSPEDRPTATTKCTCGYCEGHIEFDTADANRRISCPHCGKETVLYIPGQSRPPPAPALPVAPAARVACPAPRAPARPTVTGRRSGPAAAAGSFPAQAARASWIVFLVCLGLAGVMASASSETKRFLVTAVPILLLLGVLVGVLALFGIVKYGIRGILIPALIGILLNGGLLGGLIKARHGYASTRQQQAEQAGRKAAAMADFLQQSAAQGLITNVPATGDAAFDATLRIWTDLINKGKTLHVTMASQIKPLNEQEFLSVVASKAALKAEMDKKVSAQKLIEKCHQELTATVEEARQAVRALKLRREMERRELSSMETGGKFCSYIDSSYSLASQRQKAELDLYEFLWSESGRYRVANRQVLFTSEPKLQEFRRLTERIRGITEEAQQLERQREAGAQGVRDQLQQSLQ